MHGNSKKVFDILGKDAINEIKQNPYILLDITYGVDFNKIDKMAINLGIAINDAKRIESAIKYSLSLSSENGHTCVIKENLIKFVKDLLKVSESDIEEVLINLISIEKVITETVDSQEWIYLNTFYFAEKYIAKKLLELNKANNIKKSNNFNSKLKTLEKEADISLSKKQREAIKMVNENNVCVITGGPGTGKTTIIKFIIDLYKKEDKKKIVLCAPTRQSCQKDE